MRAVVASSMCLGGALFAESEPPSSPNPVQWQSQSVELTADPGVATQSTSFSGVCAMPAIQQLQVVHTCECLHVHLSATALSKGDALVASVVVDTTAMNGDTRRKIHLTGLDSAGGAIACDLTVQIHMAQILFATPETVDWADDEALLQKSSTLRTAAGASVVSVRCPLPNWHVFFDQTHSKLVFSPPGEPVTSAGDWRTCVAYVTVAVGPDRLEHEIPITGWIHGHSSPTAPAPASGDTNAKRDNP